MLTIKILSIWFMLSAIIYRLAGLFFPFNEQRGLSQYWGLFAQGLSAMIISWFV